MKKTTTTRKANRRPTRERKNPDGAQNQLSKRRSNTPSRKSKEHRNMDTTLEQQNNEETEPAAAEALKKQEIEFCRGQLEKAKRVFAKAGRPDASEDVRKMWLAQMSAANVAVTLFSSSRLAKAIKGELAASELKKAAHI